MSPHAIPIVATMDLDTLREPPRNPNSMTAEGFAGLRAVIREKGFLQPPLVRRVPADAEGRTWEIVDGVHRVRASIAEGLKSAPCVAVEKMTDAEATILQIAMNKLRGELDLTSVAEAVRMLSEDPTVTEAELLLTGYRDDEYRAMLAATATVDEDDILSGGGGSFDAEEEEDRAPPKPFILELTFATAAELRKVKKNLKKAGSGDLAAGLLRIIEGS